LRRTLDHSEKLFLNGSRPQTIERKKLPTWLFFLQFRGSFAEFFRCDSVKKALVEIAIYILLQEVIFRSVAQIHFEVRNIRHVREILVGGQPS
jgi:hypothetical protein